MPMTLRPITRAGRDSAAHSSTTRKNSVIRKSDVPTLAQMMRDGQREAADHGRRTREGLDYWFRQSQRLNIGRKHYQLRNDRFKDFARRIGVCRSSAYLLVKLWDHRAKIIARCLADAELAAKRGERYYWPGWLTALSWFAHRDRLDDEEPQYWLTPPALHKALDEEINFDFDPCPYPLPDGWDALKMPWGRRNFVNAPFCREDGPGLTSIVRKAIAEAKCGNMSALVIPTREVFNLLIEAGAEVRSLGRVPWLDTATRKPAPKPGCVSLFVLHGPTNPGIR